MDKIPSGLKYKNSQNVNVLIPQTDDNYILGSYPHDNKHTLSEEKMNRCTFRNMRKQDENSYQTKEKKGREILSFKLKQMKRIKRVSNLSKISLKSNYKGLIEV